MEPRQKRTAGTETGQKMKYRCQWGKIVGLSGRCCRADNNRLQRTTDHHQLTTKQQTFNNKHLTSNNKYPKPQPDIPIFVLHVADKSVEVHVFHVLVKQQRAVHGAHDVAAIRTLTRHRQRVNVVGRLFGQLHYKGTTTISWQYRNERTIQHLRLHVLELEVHTILHFRDVTVQPRLSHVLTQILTGTQYNQITKQLNNKTTATTKQRRNPQTTYCCALIAWIRGFIQKD